MRTGTSFMCLSVYADYSLRVLIYLGLKRDGRATVGDIARAYGVSKNHLMKIVQELGRLGYVETVRGKGGGLRLAKEPERISLGEVGRGVEPDFWLVQCFGAAAPRCRIEPECLLRPVVAEALDAFLSVRDGRTLADIVAPPERLADLLFHKAA